MAIIAAAQFLLIALVNMSQYVSSQRISKSCHYKSVSEGSATKVRYLEFLVETRSGFRIGSRR